MGLRRLLGSLALCALVLVASSAESNEPCLGVLHPMTGGSAYPRPFDSDQLRNEYLNVFTTTTGSRPTTVFTYDDEGKPQTLFTLAARLAQQDRCSGVFRSRWGMSFINGQRTLGVFGARNPFPSIADGYKQRSTIVQDKVAWVVVGWIPKNWPGLQVRQDGNTTVITMKDGDPGWPDVGIGLFLEASQRSLDPDRFMDWVITPDANRLMGRWFYVVPDNSTLRRRVRIDLVTNDGTPLTSTSCSSSECYPSMAAGQVKYQNTQNGQTYSVCGPASACPQFMPRPNLRLLP